VTPDKFLCYLQAWATFGGEYMGTLAVERLGTVLPSPHSEGISNKARGAETADFFLCQRK